MRILYFSRDYTTHDRRFLEKLAASRHEIWYLRLESGGTCYEPRDLPAGIRMVAWDAAPLPVAEPEQWSQVLPRFEAVLAQIRPDLIHAGPVQSCGYIAALSGFQPVMLMSWGSDILMDADRSETWRAVTRQAVQHAAMIQCDCQAVKRKIQELVPMGDERFVVFPWGVERERFDAELPPAPFRAERGWENDTVLLTTRTWEPLYGIETLLESFRLAHAQNPRLKLVMAADGSLAEDVRAFIANAGLEAAVHLPGRLNQVDLPGYYRASDVYLSCALSDGSSISLLEAMACGLPVIVTDLPSNREWVRPGEHGWLAGAQDVRGFAEALLAAAALDPSKRAEMRRANLRAVAAHADWDTNFHSLLEAYDRLEARARNKEVSA